MCKRMFQRLGPTGWVWIGVVLTLGGEEPPSGSTVIAFTEPSRPSMVSINVSCGSITVRGEERDDVMIETDHSSLKVEESDNQVSIRLDDSQASDLRVAVPVDASLRLKGIRGGNITVETLEGDIEVDGVDSSITLKRIAGAVVAHSMQGRIMVQTDRVQLGKPMSCSTMNGDIELYLPADMKADVTLQTMNGTIQSDFSIVPRPDVRQTAGSRLTGRVNGGGAHLQLKTLNGGISLRKSE